MSITIINDNRKTNINQLTNKFTELYGESEEKPLIFFAPSRINLIGEHTDYNGGNVFPGALTFGTYVVVKKRNDKKINFYSTNFDNLGIITSSLDTLKYDASEPWTKYPSAMIKCMMEKGYDIEAGFDTLYYGEIPISSGLSSSASMEVLTGYMLKNLFDLNIGNIEIATCGKEAENNYIGVKCGIMDQFVIACGEQNKALYLNTETLEYETIPIELGDYKIVVMNTKKPRNLITSNYNERVAECQYALKCLQKELDIPNLCSLSVEDFEKYQYLIDNPVALKRALHVISENDRTKRAVLALQARDLATLGNLMNESHNSLRDNYEVTGENLDTLVDASRKQEGVLGARMTGAGNGGCAIAIVKNDCIEAFEEKVNRVYKEKIGYPAEFFTADIGGGPAEIKLQSDKVYTLK